MIKLNKNGTVFMEDLFLIKLYKLKFLLKSMILRFFKTSCGLLKKASLTFEEEIRSITVL